MTEPTTPRLADVTALLDAWYDPAWAEDWDTVGLVCGDPDQPVGRVLLAVDPAPVVVAPPPVYYPPVRVVAPPPAYYPPGYGYEVVARPPVYVGGYYRPDVAKVSAVMTPSATLNAVLAELNA